jgi:hypothetical protein
MSKSKRFVHITNPKDLKTGNFYIRAVVNCHDSFWIEIFKVVQAPFFKIEKYMGGNWKFTCHDGCSTNIHRKKYIDEKFFSSYSGDFSTKGYYNKDEELVRVKIRDVCLLPFSNKAFNFLKANSQNVIQFLKVFNPGVNFTPEFIEKLKQDWKFQKYLDDECHKELMNYRD